jgi:hypothetical protein
VTRKKKKEKKSSFSITNKIVFMFQFVQYFVEKTFKRDKMEIVALLFDILKSYFSQLKIKLNIFNSKLLLILKELYNAIKSYIKSGYQLVQYFLQINDISLAYNTYEEIIKKFAFESGSFRGLQLLRLQCLKSGHASMLCGCYYVLKKNYHAGLGEFFVASYSLLINKSNKKEVKVIKKRFRFELNEKISLNLFDNQPLVFLCIGTFFVNWSLSLSGRNRSKLALNGIAWMGKYFNTRKYTNLNEAYYNIGRCAHAYGLYNLAEDYYYRSIQVYHFQRKINKAKNDIHFYKNDLTRECAFNLMHIYKQSYNNALILLLLKMLLKI